MSKTVITSSGNDQLSIFDKRFGRAAWFCLYDEENGNTEFYENEHKDASGGAGTKAAEKIISGDFGPKAKDLLDKFSVQMVIIQDENITISDIIDKIK
jgi:predicted Fe-Mo cluster-binding NifX family protein